MASGCHCHWLVASSDHDPGGGAILGRNTAELQGITAGMGPHLIGAAYPVPSAGFTFRQQKQDHRESVPQGSVWPLDQDRAAMDFPVPAPFWVGL